MTAASFHLGNGLWNFACKWGIAVSVRAQRAAGWFGAAVTVALTFVGIAIAHRLPQSLVSARNLRPMRQPKIIIVGGGLAGLMAAIRVAESGVPVDLFSIVPVKRSHSVCAQGGINAAKNLKGEGDSTWKHFDDTIYGGDFLANQPLVKGMCEAAPAIIDLLDRMGVMFNRTPEGLLDFRRFGGTLLSPHGVCRRDDRAATALRARRAGAALRIRRQSQEIRGLDVSFRRD